VTLAHDVVSAPGAHDAARVVVFLHGILGSRNNWKSFAQKLVAAQPAWRAVLCDLRNHGDSHGLSAPHTIAACAEDVVATVDGARADVVVGHSFGGKVALALAQRGWARETWVLDCPPGPRTFGGVDHSEIARVLDAIRAVPMPVASRAALVDALRGMGLSEPLAKWMTTNLRANDAAGGEGFVWKFALDAIPEMLASFGATDAWDVVENSSSGRVVMVRAGRSDRWSSEDVARLTRAAARGTVVEHVMPNAGHWLHTDDPATLLALLSSALAASAALAALESS
jgi:pimeloyl-ACP methyl ester carboxylesterase